MKRTPKKKGKPGPRLKGAYKKEARVIRISPELDRELLAHRKRKESYDNLIRRMLGLKARKHADHAARSFFAVVDVPETYISADEADARGRAIQLRVKLKRRETPKVVMVREVIL